jgi:1-acyl-sn-glycerol-3-phosphate acyltransferase
MSRLLQTTAARTVLSIWSWFVLGTAVLVFFPLVALTRLVTAPFDPGRYHAGYLFRKLTVVHQKLNPLWRFTVSGTMPDDPRHPYVVVANHESFVDILLISHLPFEMKWMSKSEFFKIPFVGWAMWLAGDIRLERGDKKSGADALLECRDRLEKKVSVMIFPEGTRTRTGELQEFKDGAFRIAIQAGAPILPLAVHGARTALVTNDWRFGYSHAEVRVLDPIPTEGLTDADVADLRDRTRAVIADALETMRAERSPAG